MKREMREIITEMVLDALFIALLWIPMMFFDYYLSVACPVMLVSFFIDRVLQSLDRDYDGLSAGGSFGLFLVSCIFAAVGGISLLVGVSWSTCDDERPSNEELVQRSRMAARVVGGIDFASMMLWMSTMPEYVRVLG